MKLTRFDVERKVLKSDLPSNSRYLVLIFCTKCDGGSSVIPDRYQPSLTQLVRDSGLSRSTVCVHLNLLERKKWLGRKRPDPHDARTKHERTRYSLGVPGLVLPAGTDPSPDEERGTSPNGGRGSSPKAGRKSSRRHPPSSRARAREEEEASNDLENAAGVEVVLRIIQTLQELAPGRTDAHTRKWAESVAAQIKGGRINRPAYVEKVIRNDLHKYLPAPLPPPPPKRAEGRPPNADYQSVRANIRRKPK